MLKKCYQRASIPFYSSYFLLFLGAMLFVFSVTPIEVEAASLFTENFDDLPDQHIDGRCKYEGDVGEPVGSCDNVPANWDFMYTSDSNPTNPPAQIMSGIGKEGKALRVYDESYGTNSRWGHDIQLAKHFAPNQYPELWVSLYVRFNPDLDTSDLGSAKIFRMGHYNPRVIDGTTGTSVVNTNRVTTEGPTTSGLMFYDIERITDSIYRHKISIRGDPDYKISRDFNGPELSFYDEDGLMASPTWENTYGDGQWHKFEVGMIMNSAPGAEDGELHVYFDNVYQGGFTDIPYRQSGSNPGVTGFNMFTIAGNADSVWDGQSYAEQHFYDIDNVAVCVTRCSAPNPPTFLIVE